MRTIAGILSSSSSQEVTVLCAAAAAKSLQSCPTLCDPTDGSPPGSFVPGILQARLLEWIAITFSNACTHAKSLQSCPTLCDPMDSSPPGSSVHRILQARLLVWVAISFSNACMQSGYSRVRLCATLWTAAHQAPLSTGFPSQEYWSGLPFTVLCSCDLLYVPFLGWLGAYQCLLTS